MPAKCTICFHEARQKIDSQVLENARLSRISREYSVSCSRGNSPGGASHQRVSKWGPETEILPTRFSERLSLGLIYLDVFGGGGEI
jgi:hypothetical protein